MEFSSVNLLLAITSSAIATPILERAVQTCYPGVYIIACRGAFESQDYVGFGLQGSFITSLLNAIPGSNASAVIHPASVVNYGDSVSVGAINAQQQIIAYSEACPNSKIVLAGCSQGAQVIGTTVLGGMTDPGPALPASAVTNIIAIQLAGDPNRALGQGTDYDPDTCSTGSSTP